MDVISNCIMHLRNLCRNYFHIYRKDFHAPIYSYISTGNKRNFNKYVKTLENELNKLFNRNLSVEGYHFPKEVDSFRMLKINVKMCVAIIHQR